MRLPVMPPVKPMLAKAVPEIPPGCLYEPKWDGFRTIVFRDGDEVELGSRNERPMTRYLPEIVDAARAQLPARCVVDGEVVVRQGERLDFEALQQRNHPAASRVNLLARSEPKWDGFRTIVFRDGDEVELGSRNERPMTRYLPEIVDAARAQLPARCVVDGEVVVRQGERLDFEALQQRNHPAASRVNLLA